MILKINKVYIKNFLSIGNAPLVYDVRKGLHYVTGLDTTTGMRNGVGKTTVFVESILYALYGKTYRKIKVSEIPNTKNQKDCLVKVEFSVDDKEYVIERGIKPSLLRLVDIESGKDIELSAKKETQSLINDIIKVDFQACKNMMLMSINGHQHFMNMTRAEKRAFIEHILNIDVLGKMYELATRQFNQSKSKSESLKGQYEMAKSFLDRSKEHNAQIEKQIQQFEDDKAASIIDMKEQIDALTEDLIKIEVKDCTEIKVKIDDLNEKIKAASMAQGKSQATIDTNNRAVKKFDKELAFMEGTTECPVCKSELSDEHKQEEITRINHEVQVCEVDTNRHETKLQQLVGLISQLRLKITGLNSEIDTENAKTHKKTGFETKISMLKNQIESTQKAKIGVSRMDIEKAEKDYERVSEEVSEVSDQLKYDTLIKGVFSDEGIKQYIVKKILPTLNNKMKYYLEQMGANYWVVFDEKFDDEIKSRTRETLPYESFSAGEQKRIDLALLMSFIDISRMQGKTAPNILVLDEIADSSLETAGLESFLEVVKEKVEREKLAVYVISHRKDYNNDAFDTIISLEKKDGFTEIGSIYA